MGAVYRWCELEGRRWLSLSTPASCGGGKCCHALVAPNPFPGAICRGEKMAGHLLQLHVNKVTDALRC